MVAFEDEADVPEKRRIRYADDEEVQDARGVGPMLSRQLSSMSQMSTRSNRSITRRRSIDPALAIPIEYRTLSFHIEETKEKEFAEARTAKKTAAAELVDLDWHKFTPNQLYTRLSSSRLKGLGADQVKAALETYGRNTPSLPPSHLTKKILEYMFGGFGSILLTGSILVFISWKPLGEPDSSPANLALAIVLAVVFLIQALFNAWQDWSSSRVMNSITGMLPDSCLLLRDGNQVTVMAPEVVPGDILFVKAGNKLPADVRFVEISSDAKFDRSILTGESMPVAGAVESTDDNYLETRCIGMQGTHCISGSGIGVVVDTGDRTVFGRIAKLTNTPKTGSTTLQKEILRFVLIIVSLMVFMNVIVLILWGAYLRPKHVAWIPVAALIVDIVTVAIAFVPEGLPIALTASLTITANIMKRNNILCKSLKTVETLGAVSVLCSDKTGTLTKNQMTASDCCIGTKPMLPAEALSELNTHEEKGSSGSNVIKQLRAVSAICNAGEFDVATINQPLADRTIIGDATDQAVLRFSESLGAVQVTRGLWRKRFDLAFNSKNKFMIRVSSLVDPKGVDDALPVLEGSAFDHEKDMLLTIKGAPDVLIGRCTSYLDHEGITRPLDETTLKTIEEVKDNWSSKGKRVILLARKVLLHQDIVNDPAANDFETETMQHVKTGLTLVGLIGIVDPPRDEIPEVVRILRGAGIRIFMVTGDFKLTAQAIARDCGIITNATKDVHDVSFLSRDKPTDLAVKAQSGESSPIQEGQPRQGRYTSIVLSGPELIKLNENQWNALCVYDEVVFARTTPEQKLRIVKEYQARDHLVGMTGDGVNDAPSLKQADIGIAPGSGSDIAIEAADMVLLESFSAITDAVLYGRLVFDNLKKTICYLLPAGTFSELWPIMTNVIFGLPQVLSSILMIIICCFTDCAAATALAYEKPEADVMLRPPRNPKKDKLVNWKLMFHAYIEVGLIETVTSFSMAFWYAQRKGVPFSILWFGYYQPGDQQQKVLNEASSIYFVNLVVMQWFNLMATRTRHLSIFQHPPAFNKATQNLYLFPAILFAFVIIFIFNYPPGLQSTLGTSNIPVEYFFFPMAFGLGLLFIDEARKWAVRRWPNGLLAKMAW
ncbi:hypothetical protein MMC18_008556 [Xylographa bjoerkii]|nr:hypothetical protein [Xylographa bjoerkii]